MNVQIIIAYVLDLLIGDPRWLPHPVVLMGRGIGLLERWLFPPGLSQRSQRFAGCVLAGILAFGTWGLATGLLWLTMHYSRELGIGFSIFLAYTTLATHNLHRETTGVVKSLSNHDRAGARNRLAGLVGRDTQGLEDTEICRALVETVAENTSDGIVAPLFYLGIGGPALALTYKAVNTLDSMVGYRNSRYINFGWASARLDDLANFIPARITALLMIGMAFVLGKDWKSAFLTAWKEGRNHDSPNAGFPEAAMAGALRIRLGGPSSYSGRIHEKPFIGKAAEPLSLDKVTEGVWIMYGVSGAMTILVVLARVMISRWF